MKHEGPLLELLTRHLAECPEYFLMGPLMVAPDGRNEGTVSTAAIVLDLMRHAGMKVFPKDAVSPFILKKDPKNRNRLMVMQVAAWILFHRWFIERAAADSGFAEGMLRLLSRGLDELASVVKGSLFVTDPDRREELVRHCLSSLDCRPSGETENQAADRLTALDSLEQQRIIRKSQEHQRMLEKKRAEEKKRRLEEEERQRQIREQMERDDESSKATRE